MLNYITQNQQKTQNIKSTNKRIPKITEKNQKLKKQENKKNMKNEKKKNKQKKSHNQRKLKRRIHNFRSPFTKLSNSLR